MTSSNPMANILEKNKAQMIGQVFIFILAGLVFILIITYGYQAISYFLERQEEVVMVDFQTDLEIAIEGVKRDYGTVRKIDIKLPSEIQGVCFFDPVTCSDATSPRLTTPTQTIPVPWAKEACELKSGTVFTVPRQIELDFQDIQVEEGYECVPNLDGRVTLRMEGTGRKAKISSW